MTEKTAPPPSKIRSRAIAAAASVLLLLAAVAWLVVENPWNSPTQVMGLFPIDGGDVLVLARDPDTGDKDTNTTIVMRVSPERGVVWRRALEEATATDWLAPQHGLAVTNGRAFVRLRTEPAALHSDTHWIQALDLATGATLWSTSPRLMADRENGRSAFLKASGDTVLDYDANSRAPEGTLRVYDAATGDVRVESSLPLQLPRDVIIDGPHAIFFESIGFRVLSLDKGQVLHHARTAGQPCWDADALYFIEDGTLNRLDRVTGKLGALQRGITRPSTPDKKLGTIDACGWLGDLMIVFDNGDERSNHETDILAIDPKDDDGDVVAWTFAGGYKLDTRGWFGEPSPLPRNKPLALKLHPRILVDGVAPGSDGADPRGLFAIDLEARSATYHPTPRHADLGVNVMRRPDNDRLVLVSPSAGQLAIFDTATDRVLAGVSGVLVNFESHWIGERYLWLTPNLTWSEDDDALELVRIDLETGEIDYRGGSGGGFALLTPAQLEGFGLTPR